MKMKLRALVCRIVGHYPDKTWQFANGRREEQCGRCFEVRDNGAPRMSDEFPPALVDLTPETIRQTEWGIAIDENLRLSRAMVPVKW